MKQLLAVLCAAAFAAASLAAMADDKKADPMDKKEKAVKTDKKAKAKASKKKTDDKK